MIHILNHYFKQDLIGLGALGRLEGLIHQDKGKPYTVNLISHGTSVSNALDLLGIVSLTYTFLPRTPNEPSERRSVWQGKA